MPQPSSATTSPSKPRVSPGERNYLRQQGRHILLQGGSESDVVNFVQTHMGMPVERRVGKVVESFPDAPAPETPVEDNLISGLSLNALQGITFGFGDEALGSIMGILTGEGVSGGIESYRERLRAWNDANPGKAFAAEMLGGFLTGAGAARALGLGAAKGLGAKVSAAALEGAVGGAVAGAGYTEGSITDRTKGALIGGAFGGVLAPAFAGAAHGVGSVLKPAMRGILDKFNNLASRRIPGIQPASRRHAEHFLLETLDTEGLTIEELRNAANSMRANGVSPTLADLGGESTLSLLSETLSTRTPVKQQLAEQLLSRQAEQGARLSGSLFRRIMRSTNFGLKNAYDAVDDLAVARKQAAAPLYEEAFQHVVPTTPRIKQVLSNPRFRAAWEEGRRIAQSEELAGLNRGLEIPDLPATSLRDAAEQQLIDMGVSGERLNAMLAQLPDAFPETLPVRGLDYMKRGLDVIIKRGLRSEKVLDAQEVRALRSLREEILGFVDEAVPSYGQARTVWGGMSQAMEAVELGQEFTKKAPPVVAREIEELFNKSPSLADFYRLGAAQSLYETATGTAARKETADIANRVFGGRIYGAKNQDALRIQALFPDAPEVAEDFMRQVAAEARLSHTARTAGTSRTGRALQEFEENVEGTPPGVRMTATLTLLSAMRDAVVKAQRRFRQDVSDDLASMFSRGIDNPAELDLLLDRLSHLETNRLLKQRFGRAARGGTAASLGLLTGKVTGSAR